MSNLTRALMMGAAGAGGAGEYVDDVFSTYLHAGVNSSSTINNGIDLSGEGGLVWVKTRDNTYSHFLLDTERGATKRLSTGLDSAEATESKGVTAFNSNGFTIGGSGGDCGFNCSGTNYAYWTFRKCPGFFDVVTWSGDSNSGRNIAHNLGSKPGWIMIKRISGTSDWVVYHQSLGATKNLRLNKTDAAQTASWAFVDTEPTSTHFTVGNDTWNNLTGQTYVAYIFAHDDQSFGDAGNESIIKCGSYTGTGAAGNQITLGFEPQWLIVKNTSSSQNWEMFDNMRGVATDGIASELFPNTNSAERSSFNIFNFNATGFETESTLDETNANGDNYIYIAIRRPHKPPEAGTEVFKPELLASLTQTSTPGFAPDLVLQRPVRSDTNSFFVGSRLSGNGKYLQTAASSAEGSFTSWEFDAPTGKFSQTLTTGSTSGGIQHFFKRASGFFDIVAYSGTGSVQTVNHNLRVAPELMIVKDRDSGSFWAVYSSALGATKFLELSANSVAGTSQATWNNTTPTSSVFTVNNAGSVNTNGNQYIAYLFATRSAVSKVGSYAGTGNNINVDCGFTNGVRFLLIKAIDRTGSWWVFDSARGIGSGNDPALYLNATTAEYSSDRLAALSSGFTVGTGDFELNQSGKNYIFLAIA